MLSGVWPTSSFHVHSHNGMEWVTVMGEMDISKADGSFSQQTLIEYLVFAEHWASSSKSPKWFSWTLILAREESKFVFLQRAVWHSVTLWLSTFVMYTLCSGRFISWWILEGSQTHHAHCCYLNFRSFPSSTKAQCQSRSYPSLEVSWRLTPFPSSVGSPNSSISYL